MATEVTGIDNLKTYLQSYQHVTSVKIYCGSKKTATPSAICCRDNGNVEEQLENYFCTFAAGDNNTKTYYVLVCGSPKGKEVDVVGFTFSMELKPQGLAVNGTSAMVMQQQTDPKLFELYSEVGFLRAENKRLQAENERLSMDLQEVEQELNEAAEIGQVVDPIEKYLPYIAPMLSKLFGVENTPVNGFGDDLELNNIIAELQQIDSNFKNNMFLLLKLAKNKPTIYKMAVAQLNSL